MKNVSLAQRAVLGTQGFLSVQGEEFWGEPVREVRGRTDVQFSQDC